MSETTTPNNNSIGFTAAKLDSKGLVEAGPLPQAVHHRTEGRLSVDSHTTSSGSISRDSSRQQSSLDSEAGPPMAMPGVGGRKRKHPAKPGKHICKYCGRGCAKPSVLEKHIRMHTNERPFPCTTCDLSFKTKSNLYKHRKSLAHSVRAKEKGRSADSKEPSTEVDSMDVDSDESFAENSASFNSSRSEDFGSLDLSSKKSSFDVETFSADKCKSNTDVLRRQSAFDISTDALRQLETVSDAITRDAARANLIITRKTTTLPDKTVRVTIQLQKSKDIRAGTTEKSSNAKLVTSVSDTNSDSPQATSNTKDPITHHIDQLLKENQQIMSSPMPDAPRRRLSRQSSVSSPSSHMFQSSSVSLQENSRSPVPNGALEVVTETMPTAAAAASPALLSPLYLEQSLKQALELAVRQNETAKPAISILQVEPNDGVIDIHIKLPNCVSSNRAERNVSRAMSAPDTHKTSIQTPIRRKPLLSRSDSIDMDGPGPTIIKQLSNCAVSSEREPMVYRCQDCGVKFKREDILNLHTHYYCRKGAGNGNHGERVEVINSPALTEDNPLDRELQQKQYQTSTARDVTSSKASNIPKVPSLTVTDTVSVTHIPTAAPVLNASQYRRIQPNSSLVLPQVSSSRPLHRSLSDVPPSVRPALPNQSSADSIDMTATQKDVSNAHLRQQIRGQILMKHRSQGSVGLPDSYPVVPQGGSPPQQLVLRPLIFANSLSGAPVISPLIARPVLQLASAQSPGPLIVASPQTQLVLPATKPPAVFQQRNLAPALSASPNSALRQPVPIVSIASQPSAQHQKISPGRVIPAVLDSQADIHKSTSTDTIMSPRQYSNRNSTTKSPNSFQEMSSLDVDSLPAITKQNSSRRIEQLLTATSQPASAKTNQVTVITSTKPKRQPSLKLSTSINRNSLPTAPLMVPTMMANMVAKPINYTVHPINMRVGTQLPAPQFFDCANGKLHIVPPTSIACTENYPITFWMSPNVSHRVPPEPLDIQRRSHCLPEVGKLSSECRLFYCSLHNIQPCNIEQTNRQSQYSVWQTRSHDQLAENSSIILSGYNSKQTSAGLNYSNCNIDSRRILTHSSYWNYQNKRRIMQTIPNQQSTGQAPITATSPSSFSPLTVNVIASPAVNNQSVQQLSGVNSNSQILGQTVNNISSPVKIAVTPGSQSHQSSVTKKVLLRSQSTPTGGERKCIQGGFKSEDEYVYVRGRGRGKYVCDQCGIRCKKPSMLKKHIRTHTDLRPYSCPHCKFSFKTKGNLTKHMRSKAHHRRCLELGIVPVPTTVDDSQVDATALAKQQKISRESKIKGANSNELENEEEDDEEDEEDDIDEEEEGGTSDDDGSSSDGALHIDEGETTPDQATDKKKPNLRRIKSMPAQHMLNSLDFEQPKENDDVFDEAHAPPPPKKLRPGPLLKINTSLEQSESTVLSKDDAARSLLDLSKTPVHTPITPNPPVDKIQALIGVLQQARTLSPRASPPPAVVTSQTSSYRNHPSFTTAQQENRMLIRSVMAEPPQISVVKPVKSDSHQVTWSEDLPMDLSLSRKVEKQVLQFVCPMCRNSFVSSDALKIHSTSCSKASGLSSNVTMAVALQKRRRFSSSHANGGSYKSNQSTEAANGKFGIQRQQAVRIVSGESCDEGEDETYKLEPGQLPDDTIISRSCHICRKVFKSSVYVPQHIRTKHMTVNNTNQKQFECPDCDQKFTSRDSFKYHIGSHSIADREIDKASAASCSQPPSAGKCGVCDKKFKSMSGLKQHLVTHAELRPYVCEYCDAGFTTAQSLKLHLKTHTQERPYICGVCGSTFGRSDHLKQHSKIHTRDRSQTQTPHSPTNDQANNLTTKPAGIMTTR